MADKTRRAELLLIFVTLIWGATFSVTKNGYSDASPCSIWASVFW